MKLISSLCALLLVATACSSDSSTVEAGTNNSTPQATDAPSPSGTDRPSRTASTDGIDLDDLEPLTDKEVAEGFVEALQEGDRAKAALYAEDAVLEFWDWWEWNGLDANLSSIGDGLFFVFIGPVAAAPIQCEIIDGFVAECMDEPTGDEEGFDDEEIDYDGEVELRDPNNYARYETLDVEAGGFDVVVEGNIVRAEPGHAYIVEAFGGAGEELNVTVTSLEDNASVNIYGPDDNLLASDVMSASIELVASGKYFIEVGPTRGNTTYEMRVNVSVPAT